MDIEKAVLKRIKPTAKDTARIKGIAEDLKSKIESYLKDHDEDIEVRFVGSLAKGTFLSDPDLDVFLLFPCTISRDDLERVGLHIGKDVLGGRKMYAEHPYTRGEYKGLEVDLVPCFRLDNTDKLLSSVDRTPFHTDYVISHISDEQRDEVRLLKRFMKGIGTYGAEPNTRGFSGYLCELLVIHYGSFMDVLKAGAAWKEGVTITIDKKGPPMTGPMVVYDPVDPKRNVASAVYIDTLATFIVACKAYLKEPRENFFFPSERVPMTAGELKDRSEMHGSRLLTVKFARPDANTDNIYSQIWKTQYALERKFNTFSFNVLRAVHDLTDDITIVYELERDILSKTFKHVGPPVWVRSSESFLAKWADNEHGRPFIEEGQWNVIADRRHSTVEEMLVEEIHMAGIGREIDPDTLRILGHEDTLENTDLLLLTELLDPRDPWES